jgi:hypothetical protein
MPRPWHVNNCSRSDNAEIVRPSISADRSGVAAFIVGAIDQRTPIARIWPSLLFCALRPLGVPVCIELHSNRMSRNAFSSQAPKASFALIVHCGRSRLISLNAYQTELRHAGLRAFYVGVAFALELADGIRVNLFQVVTVVSEACWITQQSQPA